MPIPIQRANVWIKTIRFLLVVGIAVLGLLAAAGPVQALKTGGSGVDQRYCGPDPDYPTVKFGWEYPKCTSGTPGDDCVLISATSTASCNKNTCKSLGLSTYTDAGICDSDGKWCINETRVEKTVQCWVYCKNVCTQKKGNCGAGSCTSKQRKYTFSPCIAGVPSGACEKPWCVAVNKCVAQ